MRKPPLILIADDNATNRDILRARLTTQGYQIVEAADGRWAAFEIKLGPGQVEEGAANLLKFSQRVNTAKCGRPGALGVIVCTGYGYARADGVAVIPVGALGP